MAALACHPVAPSMRARLQTAYARATASCTSGWCATMRPSLCKLAARRRRWHKAGSTSAVAGTNPWPGLRRAATCRMSAPNHWRCGTRKPFKTWRSVRGRQMPSTTRRRSRSALEKSPVTGRKRLHRSGTAFLAHCGCSGLPWSIWRCKPTWRNRAARSGSPCAFGRRPCISRRARTTSVTAQPPDAR